MATITPSSPPTELLMRRTTAFHVCIAIILLGALESARAATLPQRHPYQKALRECLARLKEEDFAVELKPVPYLEEFFRDDDVAARYWMLCLTPQTEIPPSTGIRVAPRIFTLAAIEEGDTINIGA